MSANPYLDLLGTEEQASATDKAATSTYAAPAGAAPPANPYLKLLETDDSIQKARLRASLNVAAPVNPDQAARASKLAAQTGMPQDVVLRNLPEVEARQAAEEADQRLRAAPITSERLRDHLFAQKAHDDIPALTETENVLKDWRGPMPTPSNISVGLAANFVQAFRAASEGLSGQIADAFEWAGIFPKDDVAEAARTRRMAQASTRAGYTDPEFDNITAKAIYGGLTSTVRAAPGITLSVATRSPVPALAAMGVQVEAEAYAKYRGRGATAGEAFVGAVGEGAVEVATELMPMGFLAKQLGRTGAKDFLVGLLAREIPGEQVATLLQDAIDTAVANPDKTWAEYLEERPGAAYQTLVATITQSAIMGGANAAVRRLAGQQQASQAAEQDAQVIEQLTKIAEASKLRERDPQGFAEFVQQAAEQTGSPVTEVFVDAPDLAASFAQSGVSILELEAVAPIATGQLQEALATGGAVRIPVGEFVAAGEKVTTPLLELIRTAPDAMNRKEAGEFLKAEGADIQKSVETALEGQREQQAFDVSRESVRANFEAELQTVGRFTPDVNKAYAEMLASFYGAQAQRLGVMPEQLHAKYPLRVQAQGPGGAALNQPVFHGSPHDFEAFSLDKIGTGEGAQSFGWGLYFAESEGVAKSYRTAGLGATPVAGLDLAKYGMPEAQALGMAEKWLKYKEVNPAEIHLFRAAEPKDAADVLMNDVIDGVIHRARGNLYTMDIPDAALARMLLWGRPLSEQPEIVKKLRTIAPNVEGLADALQSFELNSTTGATVYSLLRSDANVKLAGSTGAALAAHPDAHRGAAQKAASEALGALGIPGLRYLDQGSRDTGGTHNVVVWDQALLDEMNRQVQKTLNQAQRGAFSPEQNLISLLKGADLSTLIHESGHAFLSMQADMASQIQAQVAAGASVTEFEQAVVDDMTKLLDWFGIKGSESMSALDVWATMTLDEQRESHEQFARGFEAYAFEGKAPSIALQGVFQRFRAWLVSIYRSLRNLNVTLTDDVRGVMDRMLATDEAIAEAEAQRNMGPLFKDAKSAGMTLEEYQAYQDTASASTAAAAAALDARSLKDMQWLSRAKDKALRARQADVDDLRREVKNEVRAEVMAEPVYQAWQFLTGKDAVGRTDRAASGLDPTRDNLFSAIGKLGGLNREEVLTKWGVDQKDAKDFESGAFGKPVLRKGGRSIDSMLEALVEEGYILPDENGKGDISDFEEKFDEQRRGSDQFSIAHDYSEQRPVGAAVIDAARQSGRLRTDVLREMYGTTESAVWRTLSARRMTSDSRGMHPEIVADLFNYDSGDALVQALAAAPPPSEVIDARTDQRMLEMFGDITSPEALARAADEAVHNEARARFIAAELKAIEKANTVRTGKRSTIDVMARAAKTYAEQTIARLKVREIKPAQYAGAEARNAKLAEKAFPGRLEEAAMHKRNQLINNYATKAAYEAVDEVRQAIRYFRKFDKRSKTIDPDYQDQIEALLERFDFRPASLKEIAKRKSLASWVESQRELGLEPVIDEQLLDEANRQHYREMTLEEIRGLVDAVRNIEHLGRLKNRLLKAKDQRELAAVLAEASESIREHGGKVRPVELEGRKGVRPWLDGFAAGHRKVASLLRQMDGGTEGPMWRLLTRSMNEAATEEAVAIEQATLKLAALYKPMLKLKGGLSGDKRHIQAINASLTRGGRLSVALNWGNEQNRQRIRDGDGWNDGQVQAVLDTLTAPEWQFVQGVWDFIDSYWPQIAAKEKRVTGVVPQRVEPVAVVTPHGTFRGGYYPIKYDADRSTRAEQHEAAQVATEMMRGAFSRATTRRGHTKARVDTVKRPVRKSLDVVTQHVSEVVHDLAWHEWLIDTNRVLASKEISGAIRDHYGPEVDKTLKDAVVGIATADVIPQTKIDQALMTLRNNVSRSTMGLSLTTALMQPFGLTQSMVRIGPTHVLRGLARWGGDALRFESSVSWIREKSDFMRLRTQTFNRELHEIKGRVSGDQSKARQVFDAALFVLMRKMQLVADVPTWIGQYEKSRAGGADEDTAVAQADQAVLDSQGGGQTKDLAEFQRKHPMLTVFYSYFNVTYNLAAESTAQTNFKSPAAVAGWLSDMLLLMVIPALAPAALIHVLRGGGDDDDWPKHLLQWQAGYLLGTVMLVREMSGFASGFDYTGPPAARIATDITKTGKQVAQGEVDEQLVVAMTRLAGTVFGIPTVQAIRTYKGWQAWADGDAPASAILFGPPPRE